MKKGISFVQIRNFILILLLLSCLIFGIGEWLSLNYCVHNLYGLGIILFGISVVFLILVLIDYSNSISDDDKN